MPANALGEPGAATPGTEVFTICWPVDGVNGPRPLTLIAETRNSYCVSAERYSIVVTVGQGADEHAVRCVDQLPPAELISRYLSKANSKNNKKIIRTR